MIKFEVKSSEVAAREVMSRGRALTFYDQSGLMFKGDEVVRFRLTHRKAEQALKPGSYMLDVEASLTVDAFGGLALIRNPVLRPMPAVRSA